MKNKLVLFLIVLVISILSLNNISAVQYVEGEFYGNINYFDFGFFWGCFSGDLIGSFNLQDVNFNEEQNYMDAEYQTYYQGGCRGGIVKEKFSGFYTGTTTLLQVTIPCPWIVCPTEDYYKGVGEAVLYNNDGDKLELQIVYNISIEDEYLEGYYKGLLTEDKNLDSRVSVLEEWKSNVEYPLQVLIDNFVAFFNMVENIASWLHYDSYSDICNAIETECEYQPIICFDECNQGEVGCLNEDTRWDCGENDGDDCSDKIPEDCSENKICQDGECIPINESDGTVTFRTNVKDGKYKGRDNWIALDKDKDDSLEGYMYKTYYKSWTRRREEKIGETVEGYDIFPYGNNIIINRGYHPIYEPSTDPCIETSSFPVEPYASNGQELYG